jgi:hypothetical protein
MGKWYQTASTYTQAKEKAKKMRNNTGGTATIKKIGSGTSAYYSIYGKA